MKYEEYAKIRVNNQRTSDCIYFSLGPKCQTCGVDYDDKACELIKGKPCSRFNEPFGDKHIQNFNKKMMLLSKGA